MLWNDTTKPLEGVVLRSMANGYFQVRLADGAVRVCFVAETLRKAHVVPGAGDRVAFDADERECFRGEITRVRPETYHRSKAAEPRPSLLGQPELERLMPGDQRIDRTARPSWPTAADDTPREGAKVYCTAGPGTLVRVLGRTGNGSRLLELQLDGGPRASFFAAASNVLVAPGLAAGDVATLDVLIAPDLSRVAADLALVG